MSVDRGRWPRFRREWARTQHWQRERLVQPTKVLLAPLQSAPVTVRWDVRHRTEVQRLIFQKSSNERNCPPSSWPMWQPNRRQVLGDHLWWTWCGSYRNLPWRFRPATWTSQRVLQWGLRWQIRSPCGSRRSWARYHGFRPFRTLRTGISRGSLRLKNIYLNFSFIFRSSDQTTLCSAKVEQAIIGRRDIILKVVTCFYYCLRRPSSCQKGKKKL